MRHCVLEMHSNLPMTTRHITNTPGYPAPHSPRLLLSPCRRGERVRVRVGSAFSKRAVKPGGGSTEIVGATMQKQARQAHADAAVVIRMAHTHTRHRKHAFRQAQQFTGAFDFIADQADRADTETERFGGGDVWRRVLADVLSSTSM